MDTIDLFDKLVRDFIERATEVKCTEDEYIDGLSYAVEQIEVAIQAAKETRR